MTCSATCPSPRVFRYLQLLQRGDLAIYIRDESGQPVNPERIVFTIFFQRADGSLQRVGPEKRTPVSGDPGEFYAACRAGESAQPGCWRICWEFQRTLQEVIQVCGLSYLVQDAVLAQDPRDTTVRTVKFGWD